jgi:PAS domain S-box-containing protein
LSGKTPARGPGGRLSRLGIVLAYALLSVTWIAFSDETVRAIVPPQHRALVETAKGVGFVLASATLIWVLLLVRDARLDRGRADLAASEERYRMLAERSQDIVYRVRLLPDKALEYVSPAIETLTGRPPQAFYADIETAQALIPIDDHGRLHAAAREDDDRPVLIRVLRADGGVAWTEHRVTAVRDEAGRVVAIEGAARDVTARVLADADRTILKRAIDHSPVGVALIGGPATGFELTYVNQALSGLVRRPADDLVGRSAFSFAASGGPILDDGLAARIRDGEPFELATMLPRGGREPIPVSFLVSPLMTRDGAVEGVLAFLQDRSEAVARSRAESHLQAAMDASPLATVTMDLAGTVTGWNPAAERLFGWSAVEVLGRRVPYLGEAGWEATEERRRGLIAGTADAYVVRAVQRADGTPVTCQLTTGVIRDADGQPTGFLTLMSDLTDSLRREEWNTQLRRAIDHAAEAVVITDLTGSISYVNPAFEAVSGYTAEELVGRNPRVLQSGVTPSSVYEDMWHKLTAGETWRGVLVNRRKDGSLFEEEATLSAVLGPDGQPTAYVGVKRDLTLEQRLAAGLSTVLLDRAAVEQAMARIEIRETADQTAQEVCDALAAFGDLDDIRLFALPSGSGLVVPIACVATSIPVHLGEPLEPGIGAYIRERAIGGPWSDVHVEGRVDPRIDRPAYAGMAVVSAPIRHRGRTVAVLAASTHTSSPDTWIARHLKIVSELATHAGPVLGPQLETHDLGPVTGDEIRRIIDEGAYAPVFQPICDLATRQPVGWEALTRFADGTAPLQRFADARAIGLGEALEVACGQRAIEAFASLGRQGWLSVNVSPRLVLTGQASRIVALAQGAIVLELTEQADIDDYARLRGAMDLLDPPALLAVDDAGAGYASLRHVLELRPDFVKIEPSFVHEIDRDQTRQAMIAGMVRYAAENETRLIAEGIETEAERRTLLRLGVRFGQGYLLGVPSATGAVTPQRTGFAARRLRAVDDLEDASSAAG